MTPWVNWASALLKKVTLRLEKSGPAKWFMCIAWFPEGGKLGPGKATTDFHGFLRSPKFICIPNYYKVETKPGTCAPFFQIVNNIAKKPLKLSIRTRSVYL